MNCNICNEHTDTVVTPLTCSCMYTMCEVCFRRLCGTPKCPICRTEAARRITLPADVVSRLDKEVVPGTMSEFDVLFTDRHKDAYAAVRAFLVQRWSDVTNYRHQHECQVCKIKFGRFDCPLVELFYACSTITAVTILDCMTTLYLMYGTGVCSMLTPKDVYFHFFMYHCATRTNPVSKYNDINHKVANFIGSVSDSLLYFCPNMDEVTSFIGNIPADPYGTCQCNTSQKVIADMQETSTKYGLRRHDDYNCDDDEHDLIIPITKEGASTTTTTTNVTTGTTTTTGRWNNHYKWTADDIPITLTPEDLQAQKEDKEEDSEAVVSVNCFGVYSNCPICTDMMSPQKYPFLSELNKRVMSAMEYMNVHTAVEQVGNEMSCTTNTKTDLKFHYTDTSCMLNRIRHIDFYSLTKDPQCLRTPASTKYLFQTIFRTKMSYLCPLSHLAVVSETIAENDNSRKRKTKRDYVKRWSSKVLNRHNPFRKEQQKRKR
ncbi:hypothetical protein ElyMa_005789900 [Elysia marginata]|uniref:RING-type domain-containing protein n=1 Tax=Elysia marginata TaxID=1093978 RepID=A0AAV4FRN1_9GAST|nr:hypothetical protein ElyMa_005789900 [Elysia marginata]